MELFSRVSLEFVIAKVSFELCFVLHCVYGILKMMWLRRESCPLPEMSTLPIEEKDGFVFVWTGLGKPQSLPEDTTLPPEGFMVGASS